MKYSMLHRKLLNILYCFIKQIKGQAYIFINYNVINNKPQEEFSHKTIVLNHKTIMPN